MRKIITNMLIISVLASAGCSIHRIDIQQGNLITQEMVDKLKPGMDKRQVQLILGTPLLRDPLHHDRWDYYYSLKQKDAPFKQNSLQVYFENDQMTRTSGEADSSEE